MVETFEDLNELLIQILGARDVNIGDEVKYIPSVEHATKKINGDYPWVMGLKPALMPVAAFGQPDLPEPKVEPETTKAMDEHFFRIKQRPDTARAEMARVVFIQPIAKWRATVRNMNEDGTLDLDVVPGNGFILHLDKVPFDAKNKTPGSCH